MVKKINGREWFCCPKCGNKLHPVKPGARGVFVKCDGRVKGVKCGWTGEIKYDIMQKKNNVLSNESDVSL